MSRWATAVLLALFPVGCLVQSYSPFYTDEHKAEPPQSVLGRWKLVSSPFPDWPPEEQRGKYFLEFSGDRMQVIVGDARKGRLETVFFSVGGELFCDFTASFSDEQVQALEETFSMVELVHLVGVHTVAKVKAEGDCLALELLSMDWVEHERVEGKLPVSHVEAEDGFSPLLTGTSQELADFIAVHAKNDAVFGPDLSAVLQRVDGGSEEVQAYLERHHQKEPALPDDLDLDFMPSDFVFGLVWGAMIGGVVTIVFQRLLRRIASSRRPSKSASRGPTGPRTCPGEEAPETVIEAGPKAAETVHTHSPPSDGGSEGDD